MKAAKKAKSALSKKKRGKKKTAQKNLARDVPKDDTIAGGEDHIVLDEKIGIQHIADLVGTLSAALKSNRAIVIDGSAVQSTDIAALQVLVAFANSAHGQSQSVEWKCGNGALRQSATLCDLERHLKLDGVPTPAEEDGLCPVF